MNVDFIDHMGDDLRVVNAARVSMDKHHAVFEKKDDTALISYLARNRPIHFTPFTHCMATFRVETALFVAAQLKRHVVGAALNEASRRYIDSEPGFATLVWRQRAPKVKQGSAGPFDAAGQVEVSAVADESVAASKTAYLKLLSMGVAPEQARAILPQTMMTMWYWTGSLFFWANLCAQRLEGHAQQETRNVAILIESHMARLFPVAWRALMKHMLVNPAPEVPLRT